MADEPEVTDALVARSADELLKKAPFFERFGKSRKKSLEIARQRLNEYFRDQRLAREEREAYIARREENAEIAPPPTIEEAFAGCDDGPGGTKIKPEGRENHFEVLFPGEKEARLFIAGPSGCPRHAIQQHLDGYPEAQEIAKRWRAEAAERAKKRQGLEDRIAVLEARLGKAN